MHRLANLSMAVAAVAWMSHASAHAEGVKDRTIGYVLSRFSTGEEKQLKSCIARAAEAALTWQSDGIEVAMNRYNRRESAGATVDERG